MRYGHILCALANDAAHVVLAANEPPPSIKSIPPAKAVLRANAANA